MGQHISKMEWGRPKLFKRCVALAEVRRTSDAPKWNVFNETNFDSFSRSQLQCLHHWDARFSLI